jgi:hypothetical protein
MRWACITRAFISASLIRNIKATAQSAPYRALPKAVSVSMSAMGDATEGVGSPIYFGLGSWLRENYAARSGIGLQSTVWAAFAQFRAQSRIIAPSGSPEAVCRPVVRRTSASASYPLIAAMRGFTPMIFITRVKL